MEGTAATAYMNGVLRLVVSGLLAKSICPRKSNPFGACSVCLAVEYDA